MVLGGLTAEEVGRNIKSHWNQIKYCYEKELTRRPDLAGEVKLYFEIGPTGEVVAEQVKESTLDSVQVEQCMLKNVRT